MTPQEYHIDVTSEENFAASLLSKVSGLSINKIKSVMQKGAVWLTDQSGTRRLRRAKKRLSPGSQLHLYYNPSVIENEIISPTLIADENDYSVWCKPAGALSQGSKWGDHCVLARWVEIHDKNHRPTFVVHRLDKAACGLMLVAHSKKSTRLLTAMFENKTIEKQYQAIVPGCFKSTNHPIVFDSLIDGRSACTHVQLLHFDTDANQSLLKINIETGRKHQIRKHLSDEGFPIVGDRLYGGGDSEDLQLASVSLKFLCPLNGDEKNYVLPDFLRPELIRNTLNRF